MVERVRTGVVRIETEFGYGSGAIFESGRSDGSALVLTNYHVVEGATEALVIVNDSSTYKGVIQGIDINRDLAVVKICCGAFQALPFGDASNLKVGREVVAIGYALGIPGSASVTRGIISAIRYEEDNERWVIQIDAPIKPSNSGGPLFSPAGAVIGINTFKVESTWESRPIEGLGFAVSEVTVREQLPVLKQGAYVVAPTPTPQPGAPEGVYISSRYWYTIGIPSGWQVDSTQEDAALIYDPVSQATVFISVEEINPDQYPTLDDYVAAWEPGPCQACADFKISSEQRIRRNSPIEAHEFLATYTSEGLPFQTRVHWYVLRQYQIAVETGAAVLIWESAVGDQLEQVLNSL
jgi:trypsin-like peptidase